MGQRRVLIVDDEENIGRSLRLILEREGYAVSSCVSVAEAKAQSQRADAYLIDVKLPDGSGIDLVRWMKANDIESPMLMISGHGTIADAARAGSDQSARREPAAARTGRRGADDWIESFIRAGAGTGDDGGAERC